MANSRVGAVITICASCSSRFILSNRGSRYACVFPDPVCDSPTIFLLFMISGIACVCISVGCLKCNCSTSVSMDSESQVVANECFILFPTFLYELVWVCIDCRDNNVQIRKFVYYILSCMFFHHFFDIVPSVNDCQPLIYCILNRMECRVSCNIHICILFESSRDIFLSAPSQNRYFLNWLIFVPSKTQMIHI